MAIRSAYEIEALTDRLTIVQEGYLYEGGEGGAEYLLHNITPMEAGRTFLLYDYNDYSITPAPGGRHAQIIRHDSTGYRAGPDADLGALALYSSGDSIDGCYLGNGYVLIATFQLFASIRMHLFHVDANDVVTLLHSTTVATTGFQYGITAVPLDDGSAVVASGVGQGSGANARFIKVNVVNDQINVLANLTEATTYRPGRYPIRLSGNRIVYRGDIYTGSATVAKYRLWDGDSMTTLAEFEPGLSFGVRLPGVAVDGDRVFMSERPGDYRTRIYDFTGNTFAYTELAAVNWPLQVERDIYPSPYVDPDRPQAVINNKWIMSNQAGGMAMLDPDTLVWVTPAGGNNRDSNEMLVFHYKLNLGTELPGEVVGWSLVKGSFVNDDTENYDFTSDDQNINYAAPLNETAVLAVMSEYVDTPASGSIGSIYLAVVDKASTEIINGPRNSRRRFLR